MTNRKTLESRREREEREARRIMEHNNKAITEHYHFDKAKYLEQNAKEIGESVKRVMSKFSDKDIEEANEICKMILLRYEPEDGFQYVEIAYWLWGNKNQGQGQGQDQNQGQDYKRGIDDESIGECIRKFGEIEYRVNEDQMNKRIDYLLYVLQYMDLDFVFNRNLKRDENDSRLAMVPRVMLTRKLKSSENDKMKTLDESVKVIFNCLEGRYIIAELKKYGIFAGKMRVLRKPTKKEVKFRTMLDSFKGGDFMNQEYVSELMKLMVAISNNLTTKDGRYLQEEELMHKVIPESIGKTGKDLEPYLNKFNDAHYVLLTMIFADETEKYPVIEAWKNEHRYLEGR